MDGRGHFYTCDAACRVANALNSRMQRPSRALGGRGQRRRTQTQREDGAADPAEHSGGKLNLKLKQGMGMVPRHSVGSSLWASQIGR